MATLTRPSGEAMTISCRSPELKTHSARKVHPAQKLGERWAPAQAGAKRNAAASSLVFQGKLNGRITVRALKIIAWIAAVILLLVGIAGGALGLRRRPPPGPAHQHPRGGRGGRPDPHQPP